MVCIECKLKWIDYEPWPFCFPVGTDNRSICICDNYDDCLLNNTKYVLQ